VVQKKNKNKLKKYNDKNTKKYIYFFKCCKPQNYFENIINYLKYCQIEFDNKVFK